MKYLWIVFHISYEENLGVSTTRASKYKDMITIQKTINSLKDAFFSKHKSLL